MLKLTNKCQTEKKSLEKMDYKKNEQNTTRGYGRTELNSGQRNMLINKEIHDLETLQEESCVNKMIIVLIFLMLR